MSAQYKKVRKRARRKRYHVRLKQRKKAARLVGQQQKKA